MSVMPAQAGIQDQPMPFLTYIKKVSRASPGVKGILDPRVKPEDDKEHVTENLRKRTRDPSLRSG